MDFNIILKRPQCGTWTIEWEGETIQCPTFPITNEELNELSSIEDIEVVDDVFFQRVHDLRFIVYHDSFGFISLRQQNSF